jgi:hypothetical protein
VPLVGGKLYSYQAGTTTPLATYADASGATFNTNPIILDSRGEANVWLGTASYKLALYTATDVLVWTVDNVGGPDQSTLAQLAASGGSALIGFLQAGTGAVATTVQTKLRQIVSAKDFGAVSDGVTNNTAAVQAAINSLGIYGGTVYINEGCKFALKSLTFPARFNLDYRVDDDTSISGPGFGLGSSERVLFSSNSSYPADITGGIVNEYRVTAPFHPGVAVDVRKDLTAAAPYLGPGQSLTNPVRASYNILEEESAGRWTLIYQNYSTWDSFSALYQFTYRNVVTLNGIGTAQWTSVGPVNTVITGTTSGAKGFLVSVSAGATTVLWFSGKFQAGETLSDNNETTTATVSSAVYSETRMPWLAQDYTRGNWSISLPPGSVTDSFAVGGKIATAASRTAGQYIDVVVTNPAYVLLDSYENTPPNGFEITYNTAPAAASRRITLRNFGSTTDRSNMGAVLAHCTFTSAAVPSTSSFNITSITKNATGDYTLNFTNAAVRADFSVSVSTEQPLQYAYIFAYTTSSARIRIVTIGTSTLVDPTGSVHVNILGGDI